MTADAFTPLPQPLNAEGTARLTGVEIELGGLDEAQVAGLCADALGGEAVQKDSVIWQVEGSVLGTLKVYLDTALRKADPTALRDATLKLGREVVPVEIVTEPLDREGLHRLDALIADLRKAGGLGSGGSLFFGFGVHLNIEIASETADAVVRPLLAYALIEDWLRRANPIDTARQLLPFAAPYPTRLVQDLIALGADASVDKVIEAYLAVTTSRNYALDMLPVFAHLDPARVADVLTEATSARPAFHFRLPDCRIDEGDWSLTQEWRRWLTVERVASDLTVLEQLAQAWTNEHGAVTLTRVAWAERAGRILAAHGLADAGD